jgi:hypothetical protein
VGCGEGAANPGVEGLNAYAKLVLIITPTIAIRRGAAVPPARRARHPFSGHPRIGAEPEFGLASIKNGLF